MLERFYDDENKYEICLDEAGRGCLFGRVYIAAVVLPKDSNEFDGTDVKDSKKFHSKNSLLAPTYLKLRKAISQTSKKPKTSKNQ